MYTILGNICNPITPALTSNHKFIMPCSEIYMKPYTEMFRYPGINILNSITTLDLQTKKYPFKQEELLK